MLGHHPYPVRGRTLRQILRRHPNELPATLPDTRRPADDGHTPQYVLSARRPQAAG
jgi:hypothetical protein